MTNFNINVNGQIKRLSHYSVWQSYNPNLKFVDKFTHFIINIGNFVNKQLKFNKFFKKNLLSHIDITPVGQPNHPERETCRCNNTCFCKWTLRGDMEFL